MSDAESRARSTETRPFETIVGLEVHVELKTESKIFCSCPTTFGAPPNAHICEVCAGLPGALPRLNRKVLDYAILTSLALNCEITRRSRFDRKNYFYPDLPKGYQISQLYAPIGRNGYVDIEPVEEGASSKRIRIHELHMEDDAGKLIHDEAGNCTMIDLSRCGVPLLEIVTEPDFRSAEEVTAFLQTLRTMLKFIGVSDCKMQEGSLRVDVNLSVRASGEEKLGTRTEMKNLSSFRAVSKAIGYESARQWEIVRNSGTIDRETRRWDEEKEQSFSMRKKEDAAEYKYFPEPDIPTIVTTDKKIDELRSFLPELPQAKRRRYIGELGLPEYDAGILTANKEITELFERTNEICGDAKEASNWIMGDLMKLLNDSGTDPEGMEIREDSLGEIIVMVKEGKVSRASGKELLRAAFAEGAIPYEYADRHDMWLISDPKVLEEVVSKVLSENEKALSEYLAGKEKNFQFLLGQAMRATAGKADPAALRAALEEKLAEMKKEY
ncbi:MAG: Asp-tRNA(Asn)/Glu-tRNA(Gln) amidotransferase subunit GatB [Clostridiales bacterium]|nr:Asp-tRNA(Asn)/Glu-tRNA(Gln) amidotransferase subunit GatB [Clostridiales bacterium]